MNPVSHRPQSRIREALRTEAESAIPCDLDLWPRLRRQIGASTPSDLPAVQDGAINLPTLEEPARPPIYAPTTRRAKLRPALRLPGISLAALLVVFSGTAALFTILTLSTGKSPSADPRISFVPAGKVLHIVFGDVTESHQIGALKDETPVTADWQEWYINGRTHPLMYSVYLEGDSTGKSVPVTRTIHVQDDAVYGYQGDPAEAGQTIDKYPYNADWFRDRAPDPNLISRLLAAPGARIVAHDTMNGHPEVVIENPSSNLHNGSTQSVALIRTWIDTSENKGVKWQYFNGFLDGDQPARVTTETLTIATYEFLEASSVAQDFFQFTPPPKATVIQNPDIHAQAPKPSPTPEMLSNPSITNLYAGEWVATNDPSNVLTVSKFLIDGAFIFQTKSGSYSVYVATDGTLNTTGGRYQKIRETSYNSTSKTLTITDYDDTPPSRTVYTRK